jgi:hypothetical protein
VKLQGLTRFAAACVSRGKEGRKQSQQGGVEERPLPGDLRCEAERNRFGTHFRAQGHRHHRDDAVARSFFKREDGVWGSGRTC